ncbi:MAG: HD domain-containing phosphohydrolase [Planctomycetota bacterium]|jgi:putative two-component system response regulator
MNILVADDDQSTAELLSHALQKFGYDVTVANDGLRAFELMRTGKFRILLTDWQMPGMTGLELCEQIRKQMVGSYTYIIVLTSYSSLDGVVCCLQAGADDYLTKPFKPAELLVRIRAGERLLSLESRELTIFALAKLVESRDDDTGGHVERMRDYARILAEELSRRPEFSGEVDGQYIDLLYLTTPLHDIGKVGIPDQILGKPGKLTVEEFEVMKTHTTIGGQTLEAVTSLHSNAAYLLMAKEIAMTHHERWDGTGYPAGLSGEDIPLSGRITAIADVYDALTTKRSYKEAFSHEKAVRIITEGRGTHFDPRLVDAFLSCADKFEQTGRRLRDDVLPDEEPPQPEFSSPVSPVLEPVAVG